MYRRGGLEKFKKSHSLEPFSVSINSAPKPSPVRVQQHSHSQNVAAQPQQEDQTQVQPATQLGGGSIHMVVS
ncbi:hypothetical protein F3Y22_tig00117009pilonHSYRG00026 [Hibiscus syriacus]|uniref:Uncharacterized protein n=1 Tax=Hibiscus syriacus TaxID=106335 RepID=A0A6A2WF59_HIBSY|nr:hypothetical protein F3Y22_tig00117009pilonHSYRG00026 [Hibiscus syriacus]